MEPRIQYAKTSDGVSIAFWTMGSGTPYVGIPAAPVSFTVEWQHRDYRRWYERMARRRMLVLYDARGTGLSDRGVTDFSLRSLVRDVEAVVNQLGLDHFAMAGPPLSGPVAIAYAAEHPERVSHLVLWCTWARGAEIFSSPQARALMALMEQDWELFSETVAHVFFGWSLGEQAHAFAQLVREGISSEAARALITATQNFDVTDLLSQVRSPTLVIHRRHLALPPLAAARALASGIPNARLAILEGDSFVPFVGDIDEAERVIDEFLTQGHEATASQEHSPSLPSGTAVILFADIADSTALTERLGDAAFRAKARDLGVALRAVIREWAGTPVEGPTLGDGVLAAFTSAREAIEAALRCARAGDEAGLPLHLGLHAGDVTREKDPDGRDNVYGGAVNIASRIAGLSAAGEVLVSETVRSLARTSAGVRFEDRGEQALKGVGEAVRVWAVVSESGSE